jgi:hypothetical protein
MIWGRSRSLLLAHFAHMQARPGLDQIVATVHGYQLLFCFCVASHSSGYRLSATM